MTDAADQDRFEKLLATSPACVRIVTTEEEEAYQLVHHAAMNSALTGAGSAGLAVWSAVQGIREGMLEGGAGVPDTENPAGALVRLAQAHPGGLIVTLDLAPHLRDDRTLRAWRELAQMCGKHGGRLVMIDSCESVPPAWTPSACGSTCPTRGRRSCERSCARRSRGCTAINRSART
jgi:hypothetical protein